VLPILKHLNSDDYVILVDDDVQYSPEMIDGLLNSNKDAVGHAGRKDMEYQSSDNYNGPVDFLETYAGVLYRGYALIGLDEYYETIKDKCYKQDDIVIGKFMHTKNIIPEIISTPKFPADHNAEGTPELRHDNIMSGDSNTKCYNSIWNV
jgi:hypothetical protein